MNKIINLKDIKDKKKEISKRKMLLQGTENDSLNYLKQEFDSTLSEIQNSKKGGKNNGGTKRK
ncbi:hypothetical protein E9840_10670 [Tissierella creatinini]|nr:hypothetical protein E9840_10670 [Tissierella creatinini]TJX61937.1 hypothetical protein E8P77_17765 [Soehngenia saccharolytica]